MTRSRLLLLLVACSLVFASVAVTGPRAIAPVGAQSTTTTSSSSTSTTVPLPLVCTPEMPCSYFTGNYDYDTYKSKVHVGWSFDYATYGTSPCNLEPATWCRVPMDSMAWLRTTNYHSVGQLYYNRSTFPMTFGQVKVLTANEGKANVVKVFVSNNPLNRQTDYGITQGYGGVCPADGGGRATPQWVTCDLSSFVTVPAGHGYYIVVNGNVVQSNVAVGTAPIDFGVSTGTAFEMFKQERFGRAALKDANTNGPPVVDQCCDRQIMVGPIGYFGAYRAPTTTTTSTTSTSTPLFPGNGTLPGYVHPAPDDPFLADNCAGLGYQPELDGIENLINVNVCLLTAIANGIGGMWKTLYDSMQEVGGMLGVIGRTQLEVADSIIMAVGFSGVYVATAVSSINGGLADLALLLGPVGPLAGLLTAGFATVTQAVEDLELTVTVEDSGDPFWGPLLTFMSDVVASFLTAVTDLATTVVDGLNDLADTILGSWATMFVPSSSKMTEVSETVQEVEFVQAAGDVVELPGDVALAASSGAAACSATLDYQGQSFDMCESIGATLAAPQWGTIRLMLLGGMMLLLFLVFYRRVTHHMEN